MTDLYLAGPMTGHDDLNRAAFDAAAEFLRGYHEVVSPVDLSIAVAGGWEEAKRVNSSRYAEFLVRDFVAIVEATGIVFLPGWEASRGARTEADAGLLLGKLFYLYDATRWNGLAPIATSEVELVVRGTVFPEPEQFLAPLEVDVAAGAYDGDRFVSFEENPLRHVFSTGGIKDNRGKARIDLLPSRPLVAIANILAFGARKYQPHNWRRGLPWPDTYSSLMRHLLAWNEGEDLDPETGESHLAHAGCQLLFLLDYTLTGVGEDSDKRFIECQVEGCDLPGLHPTTDHERSAA